ncbi:MAG: glycosyltransferase family 4 protein [Candidatus Diapherotrites archaeon]|nr:glycosyltransferase family 4 protein [Candidatus Diapherotrites archaeon]
MKIDLVGHTVPGSGEVGVSMGISKVHYHLAEEFTRMGHETTLFIRSNAVEKAFAEHETRKLYAPAIRRVSAPRWSWVPYPFFLAKALIREKADVFHADYVTTGGPLVIMGKKPCVVSLHDVIPLEEKQRELKHRLGNALYKFWFGMARHADALILMSEHARSEAIRLGLPEEKTFAVHNGVDTTRYYPLKRHGHKRLRIGYLGGLDGRKNVELLINSFKALGCEDVELHIAGTGRNLEKFRAMNLKNARFHGFLQDEKVNEFLNSIDVFAYPTLGEGFGFPPLEAMASGTPVVAADTCSMPEVVGDAGLLAEPEVGAFSEALSKVLGSEKLRDAMSKKGLGRAGQFSWKACAEKTMKVYERVIR